MVTCCGRRLLLGFSTRGRSQSRVWLHLTSAVTSRGENVAVDDVNNPTVVKVHLKRSKCDQLQRGVDVFRGQTGTDLCPVTAVMRYVSLRDPDPGCFFSGLVMVLPS